LGQWEEVKPEEDFFEIHKAIETVLGKRLHDQVEDDSEEDFKLMRKRVE
jgi:hypothetical protein